MVDLKTFLPGEQAPSNTASNDLHNGAGSGGAGIKDLVGKIKHDCVRVEVEGVPKRFGRDKSICLATMALRWMRLATL
jgi:hypothetical protein